MNVISFVDDNIIKDKLSKMFISEIYIKLVDRPSHLSVRNK